METSRRVAILGTGAPALAIAADLASRGHRITVYGFPEALHQLSALMEQSELTFLAPNKDVLEGRSCQIDLVTGDIRKAVASSEIVMVAMPSEMHHRIAKLISPYVEDSHTVALIPGNPLGAIEFLSTVRAQGNKAPFVVGETASKIYAGERVEGREISVSGYKSNLLFSALPSTYNTIALQELRSLYPDLQAAKNILETALSNLNTFLHVAKTLCNIGLVERGADFFFFGDGLTPSIARIEEELDKERLLLGRALGIELKSIPSLIRQCYGYQGAKGDTLFDIQHDNPVWQLAKGPKALFHRFLLEDVPYGLVPVESLCELAETRHETITALIHLANLLCGVDFRATGRTLRNSVLADKTLTDILQIVEQEGF